MDLDKEIPREWKDRYIRLEKAYKNCSTFGDYGDQDVRDSNLLYEIAEFLLEPYHHMLKLEEDL